MVLGKRMEDHLRPAVAYWHTFAWEGGDPFGGRTFERPWFGKGMEGAKLKADVAFELFDPRHRSSASTTATSPPRARPSPRATATSARIADIFASKMQETGIKLLWGTANLFSNRRYMAGAATNPDPDVFAYAAGAGEERASRSPTSWAAPTTCSGAAAKATRRCSTPT